MLPPDFPYKVPNILLEGDEPAPPPTVGIAGPQSRAAGPAMLLENVFAQYGTELHLTAREPRCLYASWDLMDQEQRRFNALSVHQHLVLRARHDQPDGVVAAEAHVHPDSHHWFLHVSTAGAAYVGELGYYAGNYHWVSLAISAAVRTPPDEPPVPTGLEEFVRVIPATEPAATDDITPRPASDPSTPPPEPDAVAWRPATELPVSAVPSAMPLAVPLPSTGAAAPVRACEPMTPAAPRPTVGGWRVEPAPAPLLSPEDEEMLESAIQMFREREHKSSGEMAELGQIPFARRKPQPEAAADHRPEAPSSAAPSLETAPPLEVSSLALAAPAEAGGQPLPGQPDFWFNVNAELVIYGATEPDATVTIGDRKIRLRPDGSFSYRFALPDGEFHLPVVAVAAHGGQREARLRFARGTVRAGVVGVHPQDPALQPPAPENIS